MDTDRPAFAITIWDAGDRIMWQLNQDSERVAGGAVETETEGMDIHGLAWGHAFVDANQERNRRESQVEEPFEVYANDPDADPGL